MHTIIKKPKHLQMKNSIGGAILIRLLSDLLKEHLTKRNPIRDNILDISTRFVKDLQKVKPKLKERKTKPNAKHL